jgi:hypothetical protein
LFQGEDFASWLNKNVQWFKGNFERRTTQELTERDGLLRHIVDLGNAFESVDDAFYQFRPKALELGKPPTKDAPTSPTKLALVAENLLKRSNTFQYVTSKALATKHVEPLRVR